LFGKSLFDKQRFGDVLVDRSITKLAATALFLCMCAALGLAGIASAEDSDADVARGEKLFALCTQCHAPDGGGDSAALAPAIAGMPTWYVQMQLKNFQSGVRGLHPGDTGGLRMYPMSMWLTGDDDIRDVSAYVAALPAVETERELDQAGDAAKGAGFYAVCSACHAPDAGGNPQMGAPPLAGMSDWYLYSAIQKYKSGVRGSNPADAYGAAMKGMVATLPDDAAILDVIAYIQSLENK